MTNLPQIQPHDTLIQAVNARELHAFLQVQTKFADWIKSRIADYDFLENQDFVCVSENCETQRANGQRGITTLGVFCVLMLIFANPPKKPSSRENFIQITKNPAVAGWVRRF